MEELDTNKLRALSGGILLILAISQMVTKYQTDRLEYIMIALAGFLVGGALIQNTNFK